MTGEGEGEATWLHLRAKLRALWTLLVSTLDCLVGPQVLGLMGLPTLGLIW